MRNTLKFMGAMAAVWLMACGSDGATGVPDAAGTGDNPDAAVVEPPDATPLLTDCSEIFPPDACTDCLETACCTELAACVADAQCNTCLQSQGMDQAACAASAALSQPVQVCASNAQDNECMEACGGGPPPIACNPVTSAECTDKGAACDVDGAGSYRCYPAPNTLALCDACPGGGNEYCSPGMTCGVAGLCTAFCCDDGDCGTGTCDLSAAVEGVGTCLNAAADGPSCDATLPAPSLGACLTPAA